MERSRPSHHRRELSAIFDRFRSFEELYAAYPHPMEILVYTPDAIAQMVEKENPFIGEVLKTGVTIHEG